MKHVFDTLDGWVPSDELGGKAMHWMPPEDAAVERAKCEAAASYRCPSDHYLGFW